MGIALVLIFRWRAKDVSTFQRIGISVQGESPPVLNVKSPGIVFPLGGVHFPYPFQWEGGNFLKGFHSKKSITEKEKPLDPKRTNEKERLFDLLIHDITGPLAIVSTSANNLLQKVDRYGPLTDHQRRLLDRILRNVHRAQNLMQEMIEILRSEEGLFQKEYFSIEKTLKESLLDALEITIPHAVDELSQVKSHEEFQLSLRDHGIFIEITGKYCKSPFCHDRKKIQQILRNLMSNALKYRRERMGVKISGEMDLLVLIEDDGIGIPLDEQESIFGRFVRLGDKQQQAHMPGLGLGLTGVKTLLETMGGEITLESREGIGTRFMVRIPPIQSSILSE
jgi:signal transduction histidine kinase